MIDRKLAICAAASVVAHFALASVLEQLPRHVENAPPQKIAISVVEPPPEPPKPPEPTPPEPAPAVHEAPRARPVHAPTVAPVAKDTPPPEHPAVTTETTDEPTFGVSMESTSQAGNGPSVPVGNTVAAQPRAGSAAPAVVPLAQPVAAYEATKMPLPTGRCFGKYTDDALAAGIEGTVVLDLIVGEDGRARDIQVAEGLGHGLTQAAITALRDCHFTAGEKDGKPVPVKIRGFKIRFALPGTSEP